MTVDIDKALAICEAATEGVWLTSAVVDRSENALVVSRRGLVAGCGTGPQAEADAKFVAAARTGWPAALEELRECLASLNATELAREQHADETLELRARLDAALEQLRVAHGVGDICADELATLKARLDAIRALHPKVNYAWRPICENCGEKWPCPTVRAATEATR